MNIVSQPTGKSEWIINSSVSIIKEMKQEESILIVGGNSYIEEIGKRLSEQGIEVSIKPAKQGYTISKK